MQVLSDKPLFFLINSYTTGISSMVLENMIKINVKQKGIFENGEIGLPMVNSNLILPCGIYARIEYKDQRLEGADVFVYPIKFGEKWIKR